MKKRVFTKMLSVAIAQSVFNQVKSITDEREIGISEWVRAVIDEELKKVEKSNVQTNQSKRSVNGSNQAEE
jgi:hypothetical protein